MAIVAITLSERAQLASRPFLFAERKWGELMEKQDSFPAIRIQQGSGISAGRVSCKNSGTLPHYFLWASWPLIPAFALCLFIPV